MTEKPLEGLKVVDFSAVFAGPICTRLLADSGAQVTKVEPPMGGDVIRGPFGMSRLFAHFNAGKTSAAIDLSKPEGARLARKLAAEADVVVENYRPGIMAKFGLDYASLAADCPQLVYCSISGFGQTGPFVHRAAYAPIAHAASGFDATHREVQTDPAAPPPVWSIMVADMLTGAYAQAAILTALLGRSRHGRGDNIDVTMMESMMLMIPGQMQAAQMPEMPRAGAFQPIRTKDGFIMVCIVSDKNLKCLAEALGKPEVAADPRFQLAQRMDNREAFIKEIESWTSRHASDEAERLLNEAGVPCSRYNSPADLLTHPQLIERRSFTEFEDETSRYLVQNAPFKLASCDLATTPSVPALGADTSTLLSPWCSPEELAQLRAAGVLGG